MEKKQRRSELTKQKEVSEIDNPWRWLLHKGTTVCFLCISLFSILLRFTVSLYPYSGASTPPKFGDYEAQRHWMEITLNLPPQQWYKNSTANDLSYWGLDYPPLTAYQSYFHGLFLRFFDPSSISLFESRGYESYLGKLLMRWSVISSDVLVFFPAAFYFIRAYHGRRNIRSCDVAWHIAMILVNPCLILIDHGHFQYNCISLGLTLGAVAAVLSQSELQGAVLFSLALNHKQMSAYFAPAFFSHLLGKCLGRKNPLLEVSKLGFVVLLTFGVVWWPYLSMNDILMVLSRLAPFERGIYEDYVANFWCTTSVLIKWKRLFTTQTLRSLSLAATILACLPSMIQQLLSPSNEGFLYGLLNSSLAFYLFSFQVHEKSILLPLLPATILALKIPNQFKWLTYYALFSMFPLLCRDKLLLPYGALCALHFLFYHARHYGVAQVPRQMLFPAPLPSPPSILFIILCLCSIVLHLVYLTVTPPKSYPFLFEALIMLTCFSYFTLFALYTNLRQWALPKQFKSDNKEKKRR